MHRRHNETADLQFLDGAPLEPILETANNSLPQLISRVRSRHEGDHQRADRHEAVNHIN